MTELFIKGGPIMWPILILSIITLGVVIERVIFLVSERLQRDKNSVESFLGLVEHGKINEAMDCGLNSRDPVARILAHGLEHREVSLSNALVQGAAQELDRFNRGLVVLDTAVTLGPLLGLLGTVIGMISSFGIVGASALAEQQQAITGGIAESLITVTFGLSVAIVAIIPLNYLNSMLERKRRELEDVTTHLELVLGKNRS